MPNTNTTNYAEIISTVQQRIEKRSQLIHDVETGLSINQAFLRDVMDLEGIDFSRQMEDAAKEEIMSLLGKQQTADRDKLEQFKITFTQGQ